MRRTLLYITLFLTLALVGVTPSLAFAQAAPERFEDLSADQKKELASSLDKGKAAYDAGQFEKSLDHYRRAYDIFPHPDMLYRIGLCFERLGEDQEAVRHYRRFLAAVPDAPERARVEKTIEVIESRISKSQLSVETQPDGAIVYIDDIANGPAGYTPTNLTIKPGNYRVIVQKDGYLRAEELVTIKPGETVRLRYQLVKDGSVSAVGVASAITSIVFFSLYSDAKTQVDDLNALPPQDVSRDRLEDTESKMYTYLGLGVATAAVSAGALVWAYLAWKSDASSASIPAPSGPVVGWDAGPQAGWVWSW